MRALAVFGMSLVVVTGATLGTAARAADLSPQYPMPPVYSEPDPQFEFGTGWYLRGDASYAAEDHPKLTAFRLNNNASDWGYGFGAGFGYKFNNFLRVDVTGDYLQPFDYSNQRAVGGGTVLNQASLDRYDGLVNGYFDIGTWYGLTPYVGGGVGFSVFDPSGSVSTTTAAGGTVVQTLSIADQTRFAWALMAGVSYAVDQNIAIDLGYRHLDLGRFGMTVGPYALGHDFTRDEVRIGVRYMLN